MIKAIQQMQISTAIRNEKDALRVLKLLNESGYQGIELNGFMLRKLSWKIRLITRLAGMPMGNLGKYDWETLIKGSGLKVVSIHEDLGGILNNIDQVVENAKKFHTNTIVITGMHHFNYSDEADVTDLVNKLNTSGELLKKHGINLLYHNHNCEFRRVSNNKTAFDVIVDGTNPEYVNFEIDTFWIQDAGVDPIKVIDRLGDRIKLLHINDRGVRTSGKASCILKFDSMELGFGTMDLVSIIERSKKYGVSAVILETHRNWIDKSPVKSFQISSVFMNKYVY